MMECRLAGLVTERRFDDITDVYMLGQDTAILTKDRGYGCRAVREATFGPGSSSEQGCGTPANRRVDLDCAVQTRFLEG
jgi:hypothetical protein